MATKLRFDFFELRPPENLEDPWTILHDALCKVNQPVMVEGIPLRVESVHDDGPITSGTASKTDLNNLPVIINPKAPGHKTLPLQPDEGLGRPTAFLVTRRGKKIVLVFQYNWYGIRAGGFTELVQRLAGGDPWTALPIIEPDKYAQVMQWGVIRRFSSRVANPATKAQYKSKSLMAVAAMSGDADAPSVGVVLSMGRARVGSLNLDTVKMAIQEMLGMEHGQVESLVVSGMKSDNERPSIVDLLHHRLVAEVLVPGDAKTLEDGVLEQAVRQAYNGKTDALKKHFGD